MSLSTDTSARRRALPWVVPVVAAACVGAAVVAPRAFAGDPHPQLPARNAKQLVAAIEGSHVKALSGELQATPDLGLPQLPGSNGGDQLATLITDPSSWQLWIDGPMRQRVALLGTGQEMDLYHDGNTAWLWNSATQTATRLLPTESTKPMPAGPRRQPPNHASTNEPSPMALAARILRAANPTTGINVGPTTAVAGRSAYSLVIQPRTTATLIGRVVIDVDSATGLPLRVAIYPRGSSVAGFTDGFTKISLATPSSSVFRFTPPAGAKVSTHGIGSSGSRSSAPKPRRYAAGPATATPQHPVRPGDFSAPSRLIGKGWAGVLQAALPGDLFGPRQPGSTGNPLGSFGGLLQDASNPAPGGGRILQTRLFSVLFTTDGRILLGAVPASRLESLASHGGS